MYDLHNLGWSDFQKLCLTVTREILGQTVESFLDTGDGGRDGAFTGTWKTSGQGQFRQPSANIPVDTAGERLLPNG